MTIALRSPHLLKALIPVDNAPVDAQLKSDFHKYIQGMRQIEERGSKKQAEADEILQAYEEVSAWSSFFRYRKIPLNHLVLIKGLAHTPIPPYEFGTRDGRLHETTSPCQDTCS